jgi:hypothetical protein
MRLSLRGLPRNLFLSKAALRISVRRTLGSRHVITFHVERPHAAAAVHDMHDLLGCCYIFHSLRVHIHSLWEKFRVVKKRGAAPEVDGPKDQAFWASATDAFLSLR